MPFFMRDSRLAYHLLLSYSFQKTPDPNKSAEILRCSLPTP
jgi:hypothetical protein